MSLRTWLSCTVFDAERRITPRVSLRVAAVRRAWLRTALLEDMPGHPERITAPEDCADRWRALVRYLTTTDTRWMARRLHASLRAGWCAHGD